MYLAHFGLREHPFGVTPDPRFFYLGRTHEQALASICYGIEQRQGFVLVTGEVGTGKTLLCRSLLDRLGEKTSTALILNPCLEPLELLRVIVADFGIATEKLEKSGLTESLNRFLLAKLHQGEHVVLILDEAQTLPDESLEAIRLLSNLETDREKLLQIVLVGQPELLAKLNLPQLRQVNQRITVRCDLQPLAPPEIRRYVAHRLRVAANRADPNLFNPNGLRAVSRFSRGYPREINALCDRALLAAYAAGRAQVGVALVYRAYRDLHKTPRRSRRHLPAFRHWALPAILLAVAALLALRQADPDKRTPRPAEIPAPAMPRVASAATKSRLPAAATPPQSPPGTGPDAEIPSDGRSLGASLTTLSLRWKLERLAGEVRQWQFVSLKDRSLPAFFEKSGLARDHGMEIIALPAEIGSLRSTNLPCLASEKSGQSFRFVVLSGLHETMAEILDPDTGRRVLPVAEWLKNIRGALFFLVPTGALAPPLRPGDQGQAVLALQSELRRAGFLRGGAGGRYDKETRDAVIALQHRHGLEEDGLVGLETRLQLLRLASNTVPSLQESP